MKTPTKPDQSSSNRHVCNPLDRRDFLKAFGLGAAGALAVRFPVMAGPFSSAELSELIPADKKLSPAWVKSLFAKGAPEVYSNADLKYIGMPVGGICAGQVYLGADGKLWLWDIFNKTTNGVADKGTNGENYVAPLEQVSPLDQGFAIQITSGNKTRTRSLDRQGFEKITFRGEYPIGYVNYQDNDLPVSVSLKAYSPFIPLNTDDSAFPATVMEYTVKNTSRKSVEITLAGWLENAVCLHSGKAHEIVRHNEVTHDAHATYVRCSVKKMPTQPKKSARPDIPFEDFEQGAYANWQVEGTAFGDEPMHVDRMPAYQGQVNARGKRLVNSHQTRNGEDVAAGDAHTGKLTSKTFTIERNYINFLVGGGSHKGKTCMNLLVDGKAVRTVTGKNHNAMQAGYWDVSQLQGRKAQIEIVDDYAGGWGNIGIDEIVFSDVPTEPGDKIPLKERSDYGTMALALLEPTKADHATAAFSGDRKLSGLLAAFGHSGNSVTQAEAPFGQKLRAAVGRTMKLAPDEEATTRFVITWHFANLRLQGFPGIAGRHYAARFACAKDVAAEIARRFDDLSEQTQLWHSTWYDSTLPWWFLDRTFVNTSILATTTAHRFADGRFYGWEGIGCCYGTCTHVWHYAQAVARVFPQLERDLRRRVDFGLAFNPENGAVGHRGELARDAADDGQAGAILRAYREHQMTDDDAFLKGNWPRIKKAVEYLIAKDGNNDGIIEGAQPNTLDAAWYGKIPHISSLYLAALKAAQAMAVEMGDDYFAERTAAIIAKGQKSILKLFNGEYFVQFEDPKHLDAIGTGAGCHIDQVFGQSWAFQIGLGRLFSEKHIKSALQSLWKYNFAPDVGPFKEVHTKGRPYALAGDGGLIMCTWPKGGKREDWQKHWQFGYFNECMTGFEYQVAAHMIAEGMLTEGLAVTRAIHDRYHARLRNPYNEIECSDHYARAMASYGVYLAACGYEYHGPKGYLAFSPKLTPDNFKAAFTTAKGWGTFEQKRSQNKQKQTITIKWGRLTLRKLAFDLPQGRTAVSVKITIANTPLPTSISEQGNRLILALKKETTLDSSRPLTVEIGIA